MSTTVTATQVSRRLAEYLNRVARRDEEFIIERGGKPLAQLRPVPRGIRLRELPELFAKLPELASGNAERFARDLDQMRQASEQAQGMRDPWRCCSTRVC